MIIPPDPEKDPNLFTPADSTPSLLLSPSEGDLRHPDATHPHPRQAYGYAYGEWSGEQLPPYVPKRDSREGDIFSDRQEVRERNSSSAPPLPSTVRSRPTHATVNQLMRESRSLHPSPLDTSLPIASTSAQTLPSPSTTLTDPNASTSKLWESSTSPSKEGRKGKMKAALTPSPDIRDCWRKYRKWTIGIIILILIGLGIMTGLLVGLKVGVDKQVEDTGDAFSPWHDIDGKKANTQWAPDGSLNLTYTPERDGPASHEGNTSQCNQFAPVNTTDYSLLSIPYPASSLSVSTFTFPLPDGSNSSFLSDFFITSRGLGSSGTIEFVGAGYPGRIMQGGNDNELRVDVILRYGGLQDPMTTVNVCRMDRDDGSSGIGIYTPVETDGKVTNVYMLEPTSLPSFQIVVRLPPSAYAGNLAAPLWLDSFDVNADRMNMIVGDLDGILDFGRFGLTTGRGSFFAAHLTAEEASIYSAYNDVRGTFNVSDSLIVNVTEGSISADVILTNNVPTTVEEIVNNLDTSGVVYPSSTTASESASESAAASSTESWSSQPSGSDSPTKRSRLSVPASYAANVSLQEAVFNAAVNSTPLTSINTTFTTTSGSIQVNYLTHPPRTALTSLIVSAQGGVDVAMNPTFVGPFAVRNVWGEVRLPQFDNEAMGDPLEGGRTRGMSLGPINVPANSLFAEGGVNTTNLPFSGTTITGAAFWYFASNDTTTQSTKSYTTQTGSDDAKYPEYPQRHRDYQPGWSGTYPTLSGESLWPISPIDVQSSTEGRDSQLMVLGAYGDVRVTFDGT